MPTRICHLRCVMFTARAILAIVIALSVQSTTLAEKLAIEKRRRGRLEKRRVGF